ncbi:hypothetical protein JOF38_000030 [Paenarthrobacter nicotinovorans]|nr:hypothetical protein [Paenarthrobacter nicotinovorans]
MQISLPESQSLSATANSEKSSFVNSKGPYRPLTCDNIVPEVGLDRDSRLWKHWEVAETCGGRASPMGV